MLTLNNRCLRVSFQILLTLLQQGFYFCPLTCFVLAWDDTRRQIPTFHRLLRRSRMTVFKLGAMTRIITMSPWRLLSLNWRIIYIYLYNFQNGIERYVLCFVYHRSFSKLNIYFLLWKFLFLYSVQCKCEMLTCLLVAEFPNMSTTIFAHLLTFIYKIICYSE